MAFVVKVLELNGPGFLDELVVEDLPGSVVSVAATEPLLRPVDGRLHLRVLIQRVDADFALLHDPACVQLGLHALEYGPAQLDWVPRRVLGDSTLGYDVPPTFGS